MKIIVAILLFSTLCMADNTPILVDDSIKLQNYNQRPSIKLKHKQKLKRLAIVSKTEAKEIALKKCNEPVKHVRLAHRGQLLFYNISTKHCHIDINALDGSIISKGNNNDSK